ncbi:MAG: hypothetical protein D6725_15275, partial [Planctomycetota bacterium]
IADETVEEDEPFYLELVGIQNAQLNGPARATGYVRNNDVTVDLLVPIPNQGFVVKEGETVSVNIVTEGLTTAMINGLDVYVNSWTKPITTTPNLDHDHIPETSPAVRRLTKQFPPPIKISTVDDNQAEPKEYFFILIGVNDTKTSSEAQVSVDDEPVAGVQIVDNDA